MYSNQQNKIKCALFVFCKPLSSELSGRVWKKRSSEDERSERAKLRASPLPRPQRDLLSELYQAFGWSASPDEALNVAEIL